jgi:hypothetical protein
MLQAIITKKEDEMSSWNNRGRELEEALKKSAEI